MLRVLSAKVRARWASLCVKQVVRACACALALGAACAAGVAGVAFAQSDAPASAESADKAPNAAASTVGKLPLDEQVKWLRNAAQTGALEQMDDAQLVSLFQ